MLKEFTAFATHGGKLTGIAIDKTKNFAPSEGSIRKFLESIATKTKELPVLLPFFVDKISSLNQSGNYLLVYKRTKGVSGRYEYKLVSCYLYNKGSMTSVIVPMTDLSFELHFYQNEKLLYSTRLLSFHFESNETKIEKPTITKVNSEVKTMDKTVGYKGNMPIKRSDSIKQAAAVKKVKQQVTPQKRNSSAIIPQNASTETESLAVGTETLSQDYPHLLTILAQIGSFNNETLLMLRDKIDTILVLKEASEIFRQVREKNVEPDSMIARQALLLIDMMSRKTPSIGEIEKAISILKSLLV